MRRLLLVLSIPVCLALSCQNAAAEWISYEASGRLTTLPTWSPAHTPGNDELFVRWTWETPQDPYFSGPGFANFTVPVFIEAFVGGITVFSQLHYWGAYVRTGTPSNDRLNMLFEQAIVAPPGYPSDAGGGRWLAQMYFEFAFLPGAISPNEFPELLPLNALSSSLVGFTFADDRGALAYEATLTDIRQVPETATLLALLPGLLFAGLRLRRSLSAPC